MQDGRNVFVSWTRYGSCTGIGVPLPIVIFVFDNGPASTPPIRKLKAPGSTYSQGSAMASDGRGGLWITWEEFPSPDATIGSIQVAQLDGSGRVDGPPDDQPGGVRRPAEPAPGVLLPGQLVPDDHAGRWQVEG